MKRPKTTSLEPSAYLRAGILMIVNYILSFFRRPPRGKKLLIMKCDAIGDQVLFSHVLPGIADRFAGHEITMLLQPQSVEYWKDTPHCGSVMVCDKRRFLADMGYALGLVWRVRKERFSVVLNAVYSRDIIVDQIATASGAEMIIGMTGDETNESAFFKNLYDLRYTHLIRDAVPEEFEGFRYLDILRHFRLPADKDDWKPVLWIDDTHTSEAKKLIEDLGLRSKGFAVIAPGAGERMRCWTTSGFARIGDLLHLEKDLEILLVGTSGETDIAEAVAREMNCRSRSVIGKTSILTLAALLKDAAILVGNESGPIHLSLGVGTPAVCVMGGGHFGRFLPYPGRFPLKIVTHRMECFLCNWKCIYGEPVCIRRVTPEDVWGAAVELLDDSGRRDLNERSFRQQ